MTRRPGHHPALASCLPGRPVRPRWARRGFPADRPRPRGYPGGTWTITAPLVGGCRGLPERAEVAECRACGRPVWIDPGMVERCGWRGAGIECCVCAGIEEDQETEG